MKVMLSVHEGNAVAIVLAAEGGSGDRGTEPVTKGQTASSSYKPATLSNGVRTNIRRSSAPARASW
jgi:elongation factor P